MKLTNSDLLALGGSQTLGIKAALMLLHGPLKPTGQDGKDGKPVLEPEPYDYAPGTRWKLAVIMSKVMPAIELFERVRNDILKKYKQKAKKDSEELAKQDPPVQIPPVLHQESPCWDAFQAEITELMNEIVDVERMPELEKDCLNEDANKIPADVLMALLPLFEQEQKSVKTKAAKG